MRCLIKKLFKKKSIRYGVSEEEATLLRKLASLYLQAKSLILYSEENDPSFRSNLQTIKELRDAFDHIMRVVIIRYQDENTTSIDQIEHSDPDYCSQNIQKAIGHVYRAAFDALDGTVLSLREKIVAQLDSIPLDAISKVLPEYWVIRSKLEALNEKIGAHRAKKDIGANIAETYDRYVEDVEVLKSFNGQLLEAMPGLMDYKSRLNIESKTKSKRSLRTAITAAVIGALLGVICSFGVTYVYNKILTVEKTTMMQRLPKNPAQYDSLNAIK